MNLVPFQQKAVKGVLAEAINVAVLLIGRDNAKTALSGGLGLGVLLRVWDDQARRDIIIAARTREQGREAFCIAKGFARSLRDAENRATATLRSEPTQAGRPR